MIITYNGRPAAFVEPPEIRFADSIAVLEADHPVRRWVFGLAIYSEGVLVGELPDPYDEDSAAAFARVTLIDDDEFAELDQLCAGDRARDATLAEHFNVPLDQVARKRDDLRAPAIF